jgi:hypothetical protein
MAGLWHAEANGIELLDVEPARASFRVRAGTKEPETNKIERAHELSADDAHRVLFALTLGTAEAKHHRGLVTEGHVALPSSGAEHMANLVASEDGELTIASTKDPIPAKADAVELPLLLADGKALAHHGRAAAALGVTAAGRVYVAHAKAGATADDLAAILKRVSCTQAVLLDRGAGSGGQIFRAGTPAPPRSRYDDTTLYAMGKALVPRGFRFEASRPVEPPAKKK